MLFCWKSVTDGVGCLLLNRGRIIPHNHPSAFKTVPLIEEGREAKPRREFNNTCYGFQLLPPSGIAFGEVVCVRRAITNKFALHSLTHSIPSYSRGRIFEQNTFWTLLFIIFDRRTKEQSQRKQVKQRQKGAVCQFKQRSNNHVVVMHLGVHWDKQIPKSSIQILICIQF